MDKFPKWIIILKSIKMFTTGNNTAINGPIKRLLLFFCPSGMFSFPDSGSSCSLAAGLESLGLTDIRTLVRLMCLAAAGRAGLSTSPSATTSSSERSRGGHSKANKPISCLAYLSTAVGCLASNTPSAAKLLVQLCTQVIWSRCFSYCSVYPPVILEEPFKTKSFCSTSISKN